MKPQGISDSVAFFLLETLYAQLLLNKGIIDAARPALEAYVGKRLIEVDVPALRAFGPAPAATADKPPADAVVEDDVPDYVHKAFAQFDIPEPAPAPLPEAVIEDDVMPADAPRFDDLAAVTAEAEDPGLASSDPEGSRFDDSLFASMDEPLTVTGYAEPAEDHDAAVEDARAEELDHLMPADGLDGGPEPIAEGTTQAFPNEPLITDIAPHGGAEPGAEAEAEADFEADSETFVEAEAQADFEDRFEGEVEAEAEVEADAGAQAEAVPAIAAAPAARRSSTERDEAAVHQQADRAMLVVQRSLETRLGVQFVRSFDFDTFREMYISLFKEISSVEAASQDISDILHQTRDHLAACELLETDTTLAAVEPICQSGEAGPAANEQLTASLVRSWRGKLQQLQLEFRRAAKHYAMAVRLSPREDYVQRWRYIEQQVHALIQQDYYFDDPAAIDEAAKTCTALIVVLHDDRSRDCRIEAKALLGRLLAMIGERDLDAERLATAVEYLREATNDYGNTGEAAARFTVRLHLANALTSLGTESENLRQLEEAVRIYQSLHGEANTAAELASREVLSARLGIALSSLGHLSGNEDILAVAVDTLRAGLSRLQEDAAATRSRLMLQGRANAAMARTLVELSRVQEETELPVEAGPLYRLALTALRDIGDDKLAARLEQEMAAIGEPVPTARPKSQKKAEPKTKFAPVTSPKAGFSRSQDSATSQEEAASGGYLSRLRASLRLPGMGEDAAAAAKPGSKRRSA